MWLIHVLEVARSSITYESDVRVQRSVVVKPVCYFPDCTAGVGGVVEHIVDDDSEAARGFSCCSNVSKMKLASYASGGLGLHREEQGSNSLQNRNAARGFSFLRAAFLYIWPFLELT